MRRRAAECAAFILLVIVYLALTAPEPEPAEPGPRARPESGLSPANVVRRTQHTQSRARCLQFKT
jgi:hypothetical protein